MKPILFQQVETLLALLAQPGVGPVGALKIARDQNAQQTIHPDTLALAVTRANEYIDEWARQDIMVTGYFDQAYPKSFRTLNTPPPVLFTQGNHSLLSKKRLITVVGTRKPSSFGKKAAEELIAALPTKWGVVSGLARGIDTLAHQAALAHGHPTIAILGNGIDQPYPRENQALAQKIIKNHGLLLSEQAPGTAPQGHYLVQRDRLQSRLARCVFIAQTGLTGGTLHTARYAAMQSVPILCPSNPDNSASSEGLHALLTAPAATLPKLLPAWNKPEQWMRSLDVKTPLATAFIPADAGDIESTLNAITTIIEDPATLF